MTHTHTHTHTHTLVLLCSDPPATPAPDLCHFDKELPTRNRKSVGHERSQAGLAPSDSASRESMTLLLSLHLASAAACAREYGQCGGDGWNHEGCCSGLSCERHSEYYSQCVARKTPAATTPSAQPHLDDKAAKTRLARGSNPFAPPTTFYVNDEYQERLRSSMEARWALSLIHI